MNASPEDKSLDKLLEEWNPNFHPDESLQERIAVRIQAAETQKKVSGEQRRIIQLFSNAKFAGIAAAVLVLLGVFLGNRFSGAKELSHSELATIYRSSIDPVYRLMNDNAFDPSDPRQTKTIAWLESELRLSNPQISEFEALHRSYNNVFNSIHAELRSLKNGYDEFENIRRSTDLIDFIALYDLLEKQRSIRMESLEETNSLIQRTLEILDSEQQKVFDNLVNAPQTSPNPRRSTPPNV